MRWSRRMAAAACGAALLSACGSTVQVTGSQVVPGGGVDDGGVTGTASPVGPGATTGGPGLAPGTTTTTAPGATGTSGATTGTTSGTPPVVPGSRPRGPLQIGVLVVDTDSFKKSTGVGESQTALERDSLHALIEDINDRGGIAGRKLQVVHASMDYSSQSWDTEFEAACQKFTRDNRVGAVVYDGVVYSHGFHTCMARAGVPVFNMGLLGSQVGDSAELARFPGLVAPNSVTMDRRLSSILNKAIGGGYLRPGSKLGMIVETCPYNLRAFDRVVKPIVTRHRVTVVRQDYDCGNGSDGTEVSAAANAVLKFRSENVESLMYLTVFENGSVYYIAKAAEAQQWFPQYLLWSPQADSVRMGSYDERTLANMRGFGGYPLYDVTTPPAPSAAQAAVRRACLATMKRQGAVAKGDASIPAAFRQIVQYDACDAVGVLRRALMLSGGEGGIPALVAAVNKIGGDFVSTMTYNGVTRLGPGKHDGMELTGVSVFKQECRCFRYVTPFTPIP